MTRSTTAQHPEAAGRGRRGLSALTADRPEVAELDLNPVVAGRDRVTVVDARMRLAEPLAVPDQLGRHLRG